ncbi:MAG: DUF4369 domain-containing protein [Bacteroidales bacterium]|nr:DUF4369 domain-containing protein [Bacteroidales bacterium]
MKYIKYFIFTAVIGFFVSCTTDTDSYFLKGRLENCDSCELYLMEMENSGVRALDTLKADSDGKFSSKEKLEEESIFILQSKNDYIMLCPKTGEKIVINGDYENLATTYSITGSEESSKLKLLNDKQVMTRIALKNMSEQLQMTDINNIDSVRKEIQNKYNLLRNNQREFLISYINSNEGSLTCLVALYRNMENVPLIDYRKDFDVYKKVLKGLKSEYPDNRNTKDLERFVKEIESIQQNDTVK